MLEVFLQGLGVDLEKFRKNPTIIDLTSTNKDGEIAIKLAAFLTNTKTLKQVILADNYLFETELKILTEALKKNETLIHVDFTHIAIKTMPPEFKTNTSAARMFLRPFTLVPLDSIYEMLAVNKSLTSISISANGINVEGVKKLVEALKTNTTLKGLRMGYNRIGDDGAKILAETLKENKTLTEIDLSKCAIGEAGARNLLDALRVNMTLTRIDLDHNEISEAIKKEIATLLERNKGFAKALEERVNQFLGTAGATIALVESEEGFPLDIFNEITKTYGVPPEKMQIFQEREFAKIKKIYTIRMNLLDF